MNQQHLQDSREVADAVNALNAARTQRAEAAVNVLVAVVIATLLAAAALHFLTPCPGTSLCALAAVRRPAAGWLKRLVMPLRAVYLRTLMNACVQDIAWHQETARKAPLLEAYARQRLDELRVQLIDCDLSTRRS